MKTFIANCVRFSAFFLLTSGLLSLATVGFRGTENFPAVNFTDSYSYNEKVLFLKQQPFKPHVIALGSSMTLSNLDSETVIKQFRTDRYLNTASWGMTMEDTYNLLKILIDIYDFHTVIIVSNIVDFRQSTKKVDEAFISNYLEDNRLASVFSILKHFSLRYYWENMSYAEFVRNSSNDYQSLMFDRFGMVGFKREGFNINKQRWLNNHLQKEVSESEYSHLDRIARLCSRNKITLYFFQSPHRQGLISDFNQKERELLARHIDRLDRILKDKHHFVNSNNATWNDSLFVDGIHFDEKGAKLFTEYCFDQIKEPRHRDFGYK